MLVSVSSSFLLVEAGKVVTCFLGGFSGGIFGPMSALVWSDGHAEDVTFGIIGSILGGVAGEALGGPISATAILSKPTGDPVSGVTSKTACLFGFAAGVWQAAPLGAPSALGWRLGRRFSSLLGGAVCH